MYGHCVCVCVLSLYKFGLSLILMILNSIQMLQFFFASPIFFSLLSFFFLRIKKQTFFPCSFVVYSHFSYLYYNLFLYIFCFVLFQIKKNKTKMTSLPETEREHSIFRDGNGTRILFIFDDDDVCIALFVLEKCLFCFSCH